MIFPSFQFSQVEVTQRGDTLTATAAEHTLAATVLHSADGTHLTTSEKPNELFLRIVEFVFGTRKELTGVELTTAQGARSLTREEFFQTPGLWNAPSHTVYQPERWNRAAKLPHPIRADRKSGLFYQRYVPEIDKVVSFRGTAPKTDLATFHNWQNQPRVAFFWELAQSEAELLAYMEKLHADPHMIPTFVEFNNSPVGYFEMYWTLEDRLGPYYEADAFDRGFHFLIGEKDALGFANTDGIVKAALHFLFLDDPRTRRVMAEPRHDNKKVLRYAESSGWKKLKEFDFPHKRAALMECKRENFFNGERL